MPRFRLLAILAIVLNSCCELGPSRALPEFATTAIVTHDAWLDELRDPAEIESALSVFRRVFRLLGGRVRVYPSENHYYFLLTIGGLPLRGSISLPADARDQGVLGFSYREVATRPGVLPRHIRGGDVDLSASDGVLVTQVRADEYAVTFAGKVVVFVLSEPAFPKSPNPQLAIDELIVATSFDESGYAFDLLFNKRCRFFFWTIRDNSYQREPLDRRGRDLLIGRTTSFVFLPDERLGRRVLVGVSIANVAENNWYDGPFDQLPDNAVKSGHVRLQEYIEQVYPWTRGRVDKFGVFLDDRDSRVAITPYIEYSRLREVRRLVASARREGNDLYCALASALRAGGHG